MPPEPWYVSAFGAHYATLYAHRDADEARRCIDLLAARGVLQEPILDMGCGAGRHLALLPAGSVGLDMSAELLAQARAAAPGRFLVRGDMRRLPVADGTLGTVLSLFTAFGYFPDDAQNERPVAEAARVLRPGGWWCLDLFDGDAVRRELGDGRPRQRASDRGPLQVRECRWFDAGASTVCKEVRVTALPGAEAEAANLGVGAAGMRYTERVRVFTLDALQSLAGRHGFVLRDACGGYGGEALGDGSRWILLLQRGEGDRP